MTVESDAAVEIMHARGADRPATIGLVLGSGLGGVADALEEPVVVPYGELPGFPASGVSGHEGQLAIGSMAGITVAILRGRAHYYEHGRSDAMAVPLATLARLGCTMVVLTNAAGSLHPDWHPGSLALINDHINFSGHNPLIGATGDNRFVSLADVYDERLRTRMRDAAAAASVTHLHEGVYMWFSGPSFETPAEVRMAKLLGADLVGMSTVPEAILARRLGLKVAAVSVITNFATGLSGGQPSHEETKEVGLVGSVALKRLLRAFVRGSDVATA